MTTDEAAVTNDAYKMGISPRPSALPLYMGTTVVDAWTLAAAYCLKQ